MSEAPTTESDSNGPEASNEIFITILSTNDVLCGRGSGPNDHRGNIKFRGLVAERKAEYLATNNRQRKARIAQDIVDHVQKNVDPPGRFLKKVDAALARKNGFARGSDVWCVVDEDTALEKAKQALRQNRGEKNAESISSAGSTGTESSGAGKSTAVRSALSSGTDPCSASGNAQATQPISGAAHSDSPGAYHGHAVSPQVASYTPTPQDYPYSALAQPSPAYSMPQRPVDMHAVAPAPVTSMHSMAYRPQSDRITPADQLSAAQQLMAQQLSGDHSSAPSQLHAAPPMAHQYMNDRPNLTEEPSTAALGLPPEDSNARFLSRNNPGLGNASISELSAEFNRLSASELPPDDTNFSPPTVTHQNSPPHQFHERSPPRRVHYAENQQVIYQPDSYYPDQQPIANSGLGVGSRIEGSIDPIPITEVTVGRSIGSLGDLSNNTKMNFVMSTLGKDPTAGDAVQAPSPAAAQAPSPLQEQTGFIGNHHVKTEEPLKDSEDRPKKDGPIRELSRGESLFRNLSSRKSRRFTGISEMSMSISDLEGDYALSSRQIVAMPIQEEGDQKGDGGLALEPRPVALMREDPDSLKYLGQSSMSIVDALDNSSDTRMSTLSLTSDMSALSGGSIFSSDSGPGGVSSTGRTK